jgi:hypothetical protein
MQWYISVIPAFLRLRQEDHKFEVSEGYRGPSQNKQTKPTNVHSSTIHNRQKEETQTPNIN